MAELSVPVQKADRQAQQNSNRGVEKEFAQPDLPVAPTPAQVETHAAQLPDGLKSIEPSIEQQQLVQSGKRLRPCRFKPAQIDGETQRKQHRKIEPVASLLRIQSRGHC